MTPLTTNDIRVWFSDCAQLLDGWHNDGTAWTEWDENVRQRLITVCHQVDGLLATLDAARAEHAALLVDRDAGGGAIEPRNHAQAVTRRARHGGAVEERHHRHCHVGA